MRTQVGLTFAWQKKTMAYVSLNKYNFCAGSRIGGLSYTAIGCASVLHLYTLAHFGMQSVHG